MRESYCEPSAGRKAAALAPAYGLAVAVLAAAVLAAAPARADSDPDAAGEVARLHGSLAAEAASGERALTETDPVFSGETLRTGPGARARIAMRDGGVLTLGAEAAVALTRMVFDRAEDGGEAVFSALEGVFRMTSGSLGSAGAVTVTTPVATIGIRGTDFWVDQDGRTLSVVLLDDGHVEVTTEGGTVVLDSPREGIDITDPAAPMPDSPNRWSRMRVQRALEAVAWPEP